MSKPDDAFDPALARLRARRKRGRPRMLEPGVQIGLRLPVDRLYALDIWIARQDPRPSRQELGRVAVHHWLQRQA